MKLVFSGFEHSIEVSSTYVRTVEIENTILFTRVCRSLLSGKGESAFEPYSVWDDEGQEISPSAPFLIISDPLKLPWDSKDLLGKLFNKFESLMMEEEEERSELEQLACNMNSVVQRLSHQVNGDYSFAIEWNIRQYLKAISFSVEHHEDESYLESLNTFLDFASDMSFKKAFIFINLKNYLDENELNEVLQRLIFLEIPVILLENVHRDLNHDLERKLMIDQYFLERY